MLFLGKKYFEFSSKAKITDANNLFRLQKNALKDSGGMILFLKTVFEMEILILELLNEMHDSSSVFATFMQTVLASVFCLQKPVEHIPY